MSHKAFNLCAFTPLNLYQLNFHTQPGTQRGWNKTFSLPPAQSQLKLLRLANPKLFNLPCLAFPKNTPCSPHPSAFCLKPGVPRVALLVIIQSPYKTNGEAEKLLSLLIFYFSP